MPAPLVARAEDARGVSFVAPWDLDCVQAPCGRGLAGVPLVPGHRIGKQVTNGREPASVAHESQQVF